MDKNIIVQVNGDTPKYWKDYGHCLTDSKMLAKQFDVDFITEKLLDNEHGIVDLLRAGEISLLEV